VRLFTYLESQGFAVVQGLVPPQFSGGYGNLNYLLKLDDWECVLRRPPPGPIPPGANDMARENRILSVLWQEFALAPRSLHYCDDKTIIGAPFLIMEYCPGMIIGGELPSNLQGQVAVGRELSQTMIEVLAQFHQVEPAAIGLEDFGRPQGFLSRAVEGWTKRADIASAQNPSALCGEISNWLHQHLPDGQLPTLLHNDFKLDNIVLNPDTLKPVAVLDWDMASRGDPLFDLATLISYWTEPGDPEVMHELQQMPTAQPGFMSRHEVVATYAAMTNRDVSNFLFYRVLAMFKLGVVFKQLHARYRQGLTSDKRFASFDTLADGLLQFTHEIAHGRAF